MSTPIVVQGSAVASPFQHSSAPSGSASPDTFTKGEKQPASCRDPIFAALLWMNVIAVAAVVGIYGASSFAEALENANVLSGYGEMLQSVFITRSRDAGDEYLNFVSNTLSVSPGLSNAQPMLRPLLASSLLFAPLWHSQS